MSGAILKYPSAAAAIPSQLLFMHQPRITRRVVSRLLCCHVLRTLLCIATIHEFCRRGIPYTVARTAGITAQE
jgi:hypothetical protein